MEYKKYKLKKLLTIKNGKDHKKLDDGSYPVYGSGGYMRSVDSFLYDDTSILLPRKGTKARQWKNFGYSQAKS